MDMRRSFEKEIEIEIETYLECKLCCDIIDKDNESFYLWESGRLANVCRNCARRLLKKGERIFGITKPQQRKRYHWQLLKHKSKFWSSAGM